VSETAAYAGCREQLEELYAKYNRREFVHPDPLEFLYRYEDAGDREIAGLVAASLAYGRVAQILRSVEGVLSRMGRPAEFLRHATAKTLGETFGDFKHRFTTGAELASMLEGAKRAIERHGSLEKCFARALGANDETVEGALTEFAAELTLSCGCRPANPRGANPRGASLIPAPELGSACKRLNLYLRWMVRRDEVDPGGWESVPKAKLIVPLDVHMFRICRALGMTRRNQADMKAALEITAGFREMAPEDPVRYDFAITRLGIRAETDPREFLSSCGVNWESRNG